MRTPSKEYIRASFLVVVGISVFLVFTVLVAAPFILWVVQPYRQLDVWVVDKTVPYPDFREHASLFWLLNNEKISRPDTAAPYDARTDYYGYYPVSRVEWRTFEMPEPVRKPDLIYIADTYGVYNDEYMLKEPPDTSSLHGGLDSDDYSALQKALGGGNTLIAEFNTAASPANKKDRAFLGPLTGLEWRGWIGNYYGDLAKAGTVPDWIVANWEHEKNQTWRYSGSGLVLFDEKGRIEVLTEREDIGKNGMKVVFGQQWAKTLGIGRPTLYRSWFEWVTPGPRVEEVARYELDLTPAGKRKLDELGLPAIFPAIVRLRNDQFTSWYFAGDFADLQFSGTPYRMRGIQTIKRIFADDTVHDNSYFFWKAYVPLMHYILSNIQPQQTVPQKRAKLAEPQVNVRAVKEGIQLKSSAGEWRTVFLRGINLGAAEPGKFFTEFPVQSDTYMRWLDYIGGIGANTLRVYTLLPPEFYQALRSYNEAHPDAPLFLLQEIWPEENPPGGDYLQPGYQEEYLKEIQHVIGAVYGRAKVPLREGRAWGVYSADVSKWLIGWLVGRELESAEVMQTDAKHRGATYTGEYVSAGKGASPTEVWLAESLDAVAMAEAERYGTLHPVGIVSWPTLDPIEHDTEWDPKTGKTNRWNDRASIAIEHLDVTEKMTAGLFGAYHIYPNYPDFIVNEPSYGSYRDQFGMLRYGAYLEEFIKTHSRYPAIVAEFGMANGAGVAHIAPDGLHHGGIDEESAGREILRMYAAIRKAGYSGASIFEFMDEWAKKTWITEPFMIPFDHRVLWHNVVDPEQNYGLIANETVPPSAPEQVIPGSGALADLAVSHDASYLYLTLQLAGSEMPGEYEILLGIDTYNRSQGQMSWPGSLGKTASGLEFLLDIQPDEVRLSVIPSYNTASARYATSLRRDGVFEEIRMLVNGKVTTKDGREIPERQFNASLMRRGPFDESGNLWYAEGNSIHVRIPWNRLNVTDPSSRSVLNDRRHIDSLTTDMLRTTVTDGFVFDARVLNAGAGTEAGRLNANVASPYTWQGGKETPPYRERIKKSYMVVRDTWKQDAAKEKAVLADFFGKE